MRSRNLSTAEKLLRANLLSVGLTAIFWLAALALASLPAMLTKVLETIAGLGVGISIGCMILFTIAALCKIPSKIKAGRIKIKLIDPAGSLAPDVTNGIPEKLNELFKQFNEDICRVAQLHIKDGFGRCELYVALDALDNPLGIAKFRMGKYFLIDDSEFLLNDSEFFSDDPDSFTDDSEQELGIKMIELLENSKSRKLFRFSAFKFPEPLQYEAGALDSRLAACELPEAVAQLFTTERLLRIKSSAKDLIFDSLIHFSLQDPAREVFFFLLRRKKFKIGLIPSEGVLYDSNTQQVYFLKQEILSNWQDHFEWSSRDISELWEAPAQPEPDLVTPPIQIRYSDSPKGDLEQNYYSEDPQEANPGPDANTRARTNTF